MTTRSFRKEIASLAEGKGRRKAGAFVAEGTKCVLETIGSFSLRHLIATEAWFAEHPELVSDKAITANRGEIGEMSSMSLAPNVIAVYDLPEIAVADSVTIGRNELVLALDCIQDPGNFGTMIRLADWMGVTTVLASNDTVDCFNPKAVQATMGAIARVNIIYTDLAALLSETGGSPPVYGTFLDGENIYSSELTENGIVVMGNEGHGISKAVERYVTRRLLIPSYPPGRPTTESLNVATAASVVLSQFRARLMK